MRKVLLVEDDKKVQDQVRKTLKGIDIGLTVCSSITNFKKNMNNTDLLLIILNPDIKDGQKIMDVIEKKEPSTPVIIFADRSEVDVAFQNPVSIRGVLPIPLREETLCTVVNNAIMFKTLHKEKESLKKELEEFKNNLEANIEAKSDSLDETLLNYYTVVEQTQEGIVIVQDNQIIFTNSRFNRIIRYQAEEVLNRDVSLYFPPEIEELVRKMGKEPVLTQEPEYFESNILTKEGKIIPIDVNIQSTTFNGKPSTIIFLEDITERKKLQTQLIHTSNLAAIGQIAIGLAHDINTPLANISLLSENIYSRTDDVFIKNKLDTMDRQVDIITGIIKNLLSVYRRSREMYSDLNINEVVLDTLNITKDLMLHDLEIELHFDDDLPFVMGNPEQLGQVFLNLILNSDDCMENNGQLMIRTFFDPDYVYIDFADNGCGIPEDKIYSIFDPFYTTKKPNKGVGLGLSICQGIIHSHNGKIEVSSEVGKGTSFTVILRR